MTAATRPRSRDAAGVPDSTPVVDCDVHAVMPAVSAIHPYLDEYHLALIEQAVGIDTGTQAFYDWFATPLRVNYPPGAPTTARAGVVTDGAAGTAGALASVQRHVLDEWGSRAIVNCAYFVDQYHNAYLAQALARAVNDWLVAEWLGQDTRLRASLVVHAAQPDMAVEEIERLGGHPGIVQVVLPVHSRVPYGNRMYRGIFEAAARHDLVVALHHGGWPGYPPTSVGWPSYYIETYTGRAQLFQSQLVSLVAEGVFERTPEARVAFLESGISWLPPLLWRLDKDWKGLRRETPWLKRRPSEYVRDHIKFSSQPFDGPHDPQYLPYLVDQLGSDAMLMFSTDYPHRHDDDPARSLPAGADHALLQNLLWKTATAFYRLED